MDRDVALNIKTLLNDIKGTLGGIKGALDLIATNTTPADDSEPSANVETRSTKK